jgi:hypothetical protein
MENGDTAKGWRSGRRDHDLRAPLSAAFAGCLTADSTPDDLAEIALRALDEQRVIQYAPRDTLAILTPAGRVLVLLSERPSVTLREISRILGTTESAVARTVGKLAKSNVIARTKVRGRNIYTINVEAIRSHPDLCRYRDTVVKLLDGEPFVQGDSTHVSQ